MQSSYVCGTAWDHIEVFEGEKPGVYGVADEIAQDVVTITDVGVDPFLFGVSTRGPNLSRS